MLKKSLSFVLTVIMLLSVFTVAPVTAFAATTDNTENVGKVFNYGEKNINGTLKIGQKKTYTYLANNSTAGWLAKKETPSYSGDVGCFYVDVDQTDYYEYKLTFNGLRPGTATYTIEEYGYDNIFNRYYNYYTNYTITVTNSSTTANLSTPSISSFVSVDSGVKITWGAVSGASKYRVFYKGSNGWVRMGDTSSTSFVDTDVRSGGTYTYTVRCVNASGSAFTSSYNSTGWKYTYNMATPKITGFSSTSSGVKITWDKVTNASKYRVFYKGRNGWVGMANVTGTSYTDSDVKAGNTYTYTVRCIKSDESRFTSSYNDSGWKYTYSPVQQATPSITGFASTVDGVKITWKAVSGAQKYRVYYYGSNGWVRMGDTASTSFLDEDVNVGKTYRYTVRCISNDLSTFTSGYNTNGWTYTYNPNLATPRINKTEVVSNGIKLSWGTVSGAKIYRVYYKGSNGWTRMADTTSTSYIDTDVRYGYTYTYTVRCITTNGKGFASSYDNAGTSVAYYSTPKLTSASLSSNKLYVSISDTHSSAYYNIWYKSGSNFIYVGKINSKSGYISGVPSSLKSGNTYRFIVQGYDSSGESDTNYDENGFVFTI